ncbi:MAG: YfiR family protein [Caulobacterales bacterium]
MPLRSAIARVLAALMCLLTPAVPAQSNVSEDTIKAAFLYRFASFVEWPQGAFADAQSPIRLCVSGGKDFAGLVAKLAAGQQIGGRGFEVRALSSPDDARTCNMVFATGAVVEQTLQAVHSAPVLTITDAASSNTRGMIHFVVVRDRVRFHIDEALAAEEKLSISSRLLALAVSVRRKGPCTPPIRSTSGIIGALRSSARWCC